MIWTEAEWLRRLHLEFHGGRNLDCLLSSTPNTYWALNKYFLNRWTFSLKPEVPVQRRGSGRGRLLVLRWATGTGFFSSSWVWLVFRDDIPRTCEGNFFIFCPLFAHLHMGFWGPGAVLGEADLPIHTGNCILLKCSWANEFGSTFMSPDQCPGSHPWAL